MVFKSTVIFTTLLALFTYARSPELSESPKISVESCERILSHAGYVQVAENRQPRGIVVDTFELRTLPTPGHPSVLRVELITRGDQVIDAMHYEDAASNTRNEADRSCAAPAADFCDPVK